MILLIGYLAVLWNRLPAAIGPRVLFWSCLFILWAHPRIPCKIAHWFGCIDLSTGVTLARLLTISSLPLYALLVLLGMGVAACREPAQSEAGEREPVRLAA
jgi:hypothetical protein